MLSIFILYDNQISNYVSFDVYNYKICDIHNQLTSKHGHMYMY